MLDPLDLMEELLTEELEEELARRESPLPNRVDREDQSSHFVRYILVPAEEVRQMEDDRDDDR